MPKTQRVASLSRKYGGTMPAARKAKRRIKKVGKVRGPAAMQPKPPAKRAYRRKTKITPPKWFGKTALGRGLSKNAKRGLGAAAGVLGAVLTGAMGAHAASSGNAQPKHWNRQYSRRHPQHLKQALPEGFWETFGNGLERTGGRPVQVVGAPRAVVGLA